MNVSGFAASLISTWQYRAAWSEGATMTDCPMPATMPARTVPLSYTTPLDISATDPTRQRTVAAAVRLVRASTNARQFTTAPASIRA